MNMLWLTDAPSTIFQQDAVKHGKNTTMRDLLEAALVGLILATPFIVEIFKELIK